MSPPPLAAASRWSPLVPDGRVVRQLARDLALEPLMATILVNRGLTDAAAARHWLSPGVDQLHDPMGLVDMDKASERVVRALVDDEPILIYGDADVDGLAGTALLQSVFGVLGARPQVFVPNRAYEGYSINARGEEVIRELGSKLVISVDNGTTAREGIARLQAAGVDVIVTDHHLPGEDELPPAYAVVNPRRDDCSYPYPALCGTAVAFKLACAVATRMHGKGRAPAALGQALGEAMAWVAMGTVADMMPLDGENRVLVARGLRALPRTTHPGLRALCAVAGIGPAATARAEDIGFKLAPRINAASRLGRSDLAVALVTATDPNEATRLAGELDQLNRDRQAAERRLVAEIEPTLEGLDPDEPVVACSDHWTTGLLGLVAGRLSRRRGVPAVLVSWAVSDPGKGSVRSAAGFDAHAALESCRDLLSAYGGHAAAAGFSVSKANMGPFRQAFLERWREHLSRGRDASPVTYESEVPLVALSTRFVKWLETLEPFGQGNVAPILAATDVEVALARRMGGDGTHLEIQLAQGPARLRAVAFGRGDLVDHLTPGRRIDLLVQPKINRFRGREQVEVEVVDLRAAEAHQDAATGA